MFQCTADDSTVTDDDYVMIKALVFFFEKTNLGSKVLSGVLIAKFAPQVLGTAGAGV